MAPQAWRYWLANNAISRTAFMEIIERRFGETVESELPENAELAMVTLTPRQSAVPIGEAETYDTAALASWTRRTLHGFNFIGMIEAGLFGNYRMGADGKPERVVHFHVHCIVWGFRRPDLTRLKQRINTEEEALYTGGKPMHIRHLQRKHWQEDLRYPFKGQLTDYRLSQVTVAELIERTGKVANTPIWSFRQYAYPMRPSEMVRMVRVMASRTLDKLIVAGGHEGNALCTAIRREALLKVPLKHREEEDELFLDRTDPDDKDAD
ncbi:hypothetical protein [Ancylobacter sp.]|uniref:hypothetical protein n=1 Tax=Ancylobacter sp. TaxID=1872567 RepID=UPI003BACF7B3